MQMAARPGNARRATAIIAAIAVLAVFLSLASGRTQARQGCADLVLETVALPDPVSGRHYDIQVSIPRGHADDPDRRWPLLILADGPRAFPGLSCAVRRLADKGALVQEPVVIGLSYAAGEDHNASRNRDYTPVARGPDARVYGGAAAYQTYLRSIVIPHVEAQYRTDPAQRLFWGHSYGGLLGLHVLLTEPGLFHAYLIGSPSIWFADRAILTFENALARRGVPLDAVLLLHVGGLEAPGPETHPRMRDMIADMEELASRLRGRGYPGLRMQTAILPGKDHVGVIGPGFSWALIEALGADR